MANLIKDKLKNNFQLLVFDTYNNLSTLTHGRTDTVYYIKADEQNTSGKPASYIWDNTSLKFVVLSQVETDIQFSDIKSLFPSTGNQDILYCSLNNNYIYEWTLDISSYRFICEVSSIKAQLITGIFVKYNYPSASLLNKYNILKDAIYKIGFDTRCYLIRNNVKVYLSAQTITNFFIPADGKSWVDIYGDYTPPPVPIVKPDDTNYMQVDKYDSDGSGRVDLAKDTLNFGGRTVIGWEDFVRANGGGSGSIQVSEVAPSDLSNIKAWIKKSDEYYIYYVNDNNQLKPITVTSIANSDGTNKVTPSRVINIETQVGDFAADGIVEDRLTLAIKNDRDAIGNHSIKIGDLVANGIVEPSLAEALKNNKTDVEGKFDNILIDLKTKGCKFGDMSSANSNYQIIQNLINQGYKNFFVGIGTLYIDTTISIPQTFSGGSFKGVNWNSSKIMMITDNTPIFQTQMYNTYGVMFEDLAVEYKNQQWASTHPNSSAFYFYTPTDPSFGFYHWVFCRVRINQAAYGFRLCNTDGTVMWGNKFEDIQMYNISQNAIYFNATKGQLANQFDNIKILNYNIRDNTNHSWGKAIIIKGEASFVNLDIEDWYGEIFQTDDGYISFKYLHIERNHLYDTNLYHRIFQINGNCSVEHFNYSSAVYPASITKYVRLFDVSTSYSSLYVNQASVSNNNVLGVLVFINAINNPRINLNGVTMQTFTNVYSTAVNPEIATCTNLVVDGKPFRELFKFSSKPTNIDVNLSEYYYSKNIQTGQPLGWVAKCNAYVTPNPSTLTATYASVNNSNVITGSGNPFTEAFKTGDKIILAGVTSEIYTVQTVTSSSSLTTVETIPHSYNSVTIKYANPITATTTNGSTTINLSGYAKGIFKINDGIVLNANSSEVYVVTAIAANALTVSSPITHDYINVQIDVANVSNGNVFLAYGIIA